MPPPRLPNPVERYAIPWNGGEVSCLRRTGVKRALVLLHGLYGGAIHFDAAFSDTALSRHALLAIDLPGFGYSDKVEPTTIQTVAEAVKGMIDDQKFDKKPWLVAHSLSGSVAARILDDVIGVSLIEGNILEDHLRFSDDVIAHDRAAYGGIFSRLEKNALVALRFQTQPRDRESLKRYAATYAQCTADTVWDIAKDSNEDIRAHTTRALFADWRGPLYCLFGSEGSYGETIHDVQEALSCAVLREISNSGHFPMIDNPEETYAAIAAHMQNRSSHA